MSRVVLITGCTDGGLGHALVEEFAAHDSIIIYATARRLESMSFSNPTVKCLALDVTNDENVRSVVSTILSNEGHLDILVNNAGILGAGPLIDNSMDNVRQNFETNTFGPLRLAKAVIPSMAERGTGQIINIGSIAGEAPTPWNGLYCAAKSALHTLTDVLYMECKPLGIKVMLVAPGSIRSNIALNESNRFQLPSDSLYKEYLPNILKRIFTSQEHPMSAAQFSKRLVGKVLQSESPYFLAFGPNASTLWILKRFFPRFLMLDILWRRFSKREANDRT